jgi:RHS repeat-associated protein
LGSTADESGGGQWVVGAGATFPYDSAGNRRDKGGQYGVGNRIQQFDGCTYQTDFDGNVTQRACGSDIVNFTWSAESRLIGMTTAGKTLAFYYNTDGQLIRKDVNGSARSHFVWDQGNLLVELDGAGTAKRLEYSYNGTDTPHAIMSANATYYAHQDGFGNVIGLTDSTVNVRSLFDYDAWGQNLGDSGDTLNRARFKGALWLGSEQDIYFMRARWYEPKTGRFLSEDPIGLEGGLNQYAYAGNDPINSSDALGLCENDDDRLVSEREIELDGVTATAQRCQSGDGRVYLWLENISMPAVTVWGAGPEPTLLDESWDTPTVFSSWLDQMVNMDQTPWQLCPLVACLPLKPVSPNQVKQCAAAEAWTAIHAYVDASGAREIGPVLAGTMKVSTWLSRTIRNHLFVGTIEPSTKTGNLPTGRELLQDVAGGFLPGYGYANALAEQHAACMRY